MCNKARFTTEAMALQRLTEIKIKGEDRGKKPVRVYMCNVCGGFHLTSIKLDKKQLNKLKKIKAGKIRKIADEWIKRKGWKRDEE